MYVVSLADDPQNMSKYGHIVGPEQNSTQETASLVGREWDPNVLTVDRWQPRFFRLRGGWSQQGAMLIISPARIGQRGNHWATCPQLQVLRVRAEAVVVSSSKRRRGARVGIVTSSNRGRKPEQVSQNPTEQVLGLVMTAKETPDKSWAERLHWKYPLSRMPCHQFLAPTSTFLQQHVLFDSSRQPNLLHSGR